MIIDRSIDCHIHTSLCRHASGSMEDYVRAAINAGLQRMVFLEHLEAGIDAAFRSWLTEADFDVYFSEGERLRERYGTQIEIGLGAEVGYNPEAREELLERIGKRNWDRIGLSCHFARVPGYPEHLNLLSRRRKNQELIEHYGSGKMLSRYFANLIEAVSIIPADVLCHLDAGLRHQPDLHLEESHWVQIEALLQAIKKAGIALEINTSGYTYRDQPFPAHQIIARAAELGIVFSAGSDAHKPSEVGRYFDRLDNLPI
jgi:histidinol-phosphatase (PHP family)